MILGCSSRIRILFFTHPGSRSATLYRYSTLLIFQILLFWRIFAESPISKTLMYGYLERRSRAPGWTWRGRRWGRCSGRGRRPSRWPPHPRRAASPRSGARWRRSSPSSRSSSAPVKKAVLRIRIRIYRIHMFWPPGSGSGSFYHHAKIVTKTLIPTILWLFLTFYLLKMM